MMYRFLYGWSKNDQCGSRVSATESAASSPKLPGISALFSPKYCYLSPVSGIHLWILEPNDKELLKEYVEHGSEEASYCQPRCRSYYRRKFPAWHLDRLTHDA